MLHHSKFLGSKSVWGTGTFLFAQRIFRRDLGRLKICRETYQRVKRGDGHWMRKAALKINTSVFLADDNDRSVDKLYSLLNQTLKSWVFLNLKFREPKTTFLDISLVSVHNCMSHFANRQTAFHPGSVFTVLSWDALELLFFYKTSDEPKSVTNNESVRLNTHFTNIEHHAHEWMY